MEKLGQTGTEIPVIYKFRVGLAGVGDFFLFAFYLCWKYVSLMAVTLQHEQFHRNSGINVKFDQLKIYAYPLSVQSMLGRVAGKLKIL